MRNCERRSLSPTTYSSLLSILLRMSTIEHSKGDKTAHGTHDYPSPLQDITQDEWDVVIVGAGPAGLMAATCLTRFGGHKILVVDERSEPTTAGRADGIQPRTIEVLRNMEPLGSEFVNRSAASFERSFWDPRADGKPGIERTNRAQSFPYDMEIQDNCTLGLQQGLIEGGFLRDMYRHGGQRVHRPWGFDDFAFTSDKTYPVDVTLRKMQPVQETTNEGGAPTYIVKPTGETRKVRTKYLIGCDGGRSKVRTRMQERHQVEFQGDWVDTLWAALDCVVETDFPDVRKIAAIHSQSHGALYIFPRENNEKGQPIIRAYTQVNKLGGNKMQGEARDMKDKVTAEMVMKAINEIAHPYHFDFKSVEWFTCYPIGQRLVSRYSLPAGKDPRTGSHFDGHRVMIAGDACHTHSPKAGQGMNTAIIDAQALSWRINLVEKGLAQREALLSTYHLERHKTGKQLIDFDSEYAALFSGEIPKTAPELKGASAEQLKKHFFQVQRRNAAFTTGAGVMYDDNCLIYRDPSVLGTRRTQTRLEAGKRLLPAWATRWISSTPVRIIHEVQLTAPGGFRIYICGGSLSEEKAFKRLQDFSSYLVNDSNSFLNRFKAIHSASSNLPHGYYQEKPAALNSGLKGFTEEYNPFFHLLLIVKNNRFSFEPKDVSSLGPLKTWLYADDQEPGGKTISNKDGDESIGGLHRKWGLDQEGGIVVCRPDGYVGVVVPLEPSGWKALEKYFDGVLQPAVASSHSQTRAMDSARL
ncbi:unnamed protein product [Sympodiomycopsis kandeliae]